MKKKVKLVSPKKANAALERAIRSLNKALKHAMILSSMLSSMESKKK